MNRIFVILGLLWGVSFGQTDKFTPKQPERWKSPDSLYIGADFVHITNDSVVVTHYFNEASWEGYLYFIPPEFPDSQHFVFSNKTTKGSSVNLSRLFNIPIGDTVRFMYKVVRGGGPQDKQPKYTGPNSDPSSPYYSTGEGTYGHRFSVAGRIDEKNVEFGFEDAVNGDDDFNDIIFHVSGLHLNVEVEVMPPFANPAGKEFSGALQVTLQTVTPGADIHYTTNGSTPTPDSPKYVGPISFDTSTALKAIAVKSGRKSLVLTERYTLKLEPPTANPPGKAFTDTLHVTLQTVNPSAEIHYTTNGLVPTPNSPKYTGPILITSTTTLKAIAVKSGTVSTVTTELYTLVELYFADNTGKPITQVQGRSNTVRLYAKGELLRPNAIDSLTVSLSATSGDSYNAVLKETSANSGLYRADVTVVFGPVVSGNNVIESPFNPNVKSNVLTVIARYESAETKLTASAEAIRAKKAWITDSDMDGRADKVYIEFMQALPALPAAVTDIHWPHNGSETRTAPAHPSTPDINPLFFEDSLKKTIVIADLTGDPFQFGATSASAENPPTLMLTTGETVVINDSVAPIILEADKKPSDFRRYAIKSGADTTFGHTYPDTLIITFSEKIVPKNPKKPAWETLLVYAGESDSTVTNVPLAGKPVPITPDGRTWVFLIDNSNIDSLISVDDNILLNHQSPWSDTAGNGLSTYSVPVEGRDGISHNLIILPRVKVNGIDKGGVVFTDELPLLDSNRRYLDYLPSRTVKSWIPPIGMDSDGSISDNTDNCSSQYTEIVDFPGSNCLLSVMVSSEYHDGPYVAEINIFDNLGKFIFHSVQKFGYCGELEDQNRRINGRIINDLIWNQKDSQGNFVGSGVYIWIIKIRFNYIDTEKFMVKQGIARSQNPEEGCAGGK